FLQRARDAADPEFHAFANVRRNVSAKDNIGNRESSARLQNAKRFANHAVLISRKIDDAVGDDDVDGIIGERNIFDGSFEEFYVFGAGFFLIFAGQREHFVRHVKPISFTGGPDSLGGKDDVNAAAGAEIENGLARLQFHEGGRIAAPQGGGHGLLGQGGFFGVAVQVRGY